MNDFKFGTASLKRLEGVHPDLQNLCYAALDRSSIDFGITCGLRTAEEQQRLYDAGKSHLAPPRGRHLTGLAVDVAPSGSAHYATDQATDAALCQIALAFSHAADDSNNTGFQLIWGGLWKPIWQTPFTPDILVRRRLAGDFVDAWHFELRAC